LVSTLEKEQKQYTLDRFLRQLEKTDLLICDELGYVSFSRNGVELLFRVFTNRYERSSLLLTSNLAFSDWNQVFQGERMTAALLDRLTHRCHIFEMNGESYRFRESMNSLSAHLGLNISEFPAPGPLRRRRPTGGGPADGGSSSATGSAWS
jgi:DNA replication protein DnaC